MKPGIIYGVGHIRMKDDQGNYLTLATIQGIEFSATSTENAVRGGDGPFPLDTFVTEKSATFAVTEARFTPQFLKIALGADIVEGSATVTEPYETFVVPAEAPYTYTLQNGASMVADSDRLVYKDTGETLTRVPAAPAAAGEYSISSGTITFHASDAGKGIIAEYSYTLSNVVTASIKTDSLPGPVEVIHRAQYRDDAGSEKKVFIHIYKARSNGAFTINLGQGQAYAPRIDLAVLDPQRADRKFFDIIWTE